MMRGMVLAVSHIMFGKALSCLEATEMVAGDQVQWQFGVE